MNFNIFRHRKTHRQALQILIIPDDKAEPTTFSVPVRRFRLYKILGGVLILHLMLGLVAYVQVGRLYSDNKKLAHLNQQLRENNEKVFELMSVFEDLEASQSKIRAALGLGSVNPEDVQTASEMTSINNIMPDYVPSLERSQPVRNKQSMNLEDQLGMLHNVDSGVHDYVSSIPTFLPVEGVLTNDFTNKDLDDISHRGIDIAAPRGSFVRAAADGVVVFGGWTPDLGDLLVIYHGSGFFTYYGHNQRLLIERNALVKKGEPIALLGNTGHSSAPHLHFEIWKDGVPLDPKQYILAFTQSS